MRNHPEARRGYALALAEADAIRDELVAALEEAKYERLPLLDKLSAALARAKGQA